MFLKCISCILLKGVFETDSGVSKEFPFYSSRVVVVAHFLVLMMMRAVGTVSSRVQAYQDSGMSLLLLDIYKLLLHQEQFLLQIDMFPGALGTPPEAADFDSPTSGHSQISVSL